MSHKKAKQQRKRGPAVRQQEDHPDLHSLAASIPDYHAIPFRLIANRSRKQIDVAYLCEPAAVRKKYFEDVNALGQTFQGEKAHQILRGLADWLQGAIAARLTQHSVFYWLHLYRRIGVGIHQGVESKKDANTVALMRQVCEAAIQKFGSLEARSDVVLADEVGWSAVLGGQFKDLWSKVLGSKNYDQYVRLLSAGKQWVLHHFSDQDLVDIYAVEGLAYQYWRCTAKLRAVAKGSSIQVGLDGALHQSESAEIYRLIESYDRRIGKPTILFSNSGLIARVSDLERQPLQHLLLFEYNVHRRSFANMFAHIGGMPSDFEPNFAIDVVDARAYLKGHAVLAGPFAGKYGIPLGHLVAFLVSVPALAMGKLGEYGMPPWRLIYTLTKRAYHVLGYSRAELAEGLVAFGRESCNALGVSDQGIEISASAFLDKYTLSPTAQTNISLWTHGPRCIFLPYRECFVMDISGASLVLMNLFYGVRDNFGNKGVEFEQSARDYLAAEGFNVLANRELRTKEGLKRETDIAIRINDALILCDCRTIERPLDIEIGAPGRLEKRNDFLRDKLAAINSIQLFVEQSPTGANYDFGWASKVLSVGVTPFREWIPSEKEEWWVDKSSDLPRIMSLAELRDWLKSSLVS
ncbi:MAG: hypothetical protein Q8M93_04220 [Polaromonas sp.]|uniref:hypothetical protein n=1 Tax=Polaromonas sp. TaxID=1869339 RepID=UPI0027339E57|nr:hypothetical protein [Polaromonas sp.]MDP3246152.1 hypothetical protein [Polaromonas sp.]